MARCLQCASERNENEQYYYVTDMGPEIISVIEQKFGHQVDNNGAMCPQCFGIVMQQMYIDGPLKDEVKPQHRYNKNVCVLCLNSLHSRRTHSLPEGPERQIIAETIAPRVIPDGSLVCFCCWIYTRRTLQKQGIKAAPAVDVNKCVWCYRSLAQTRRHSIPEGPERNEIIARIYPREIPPGGLVCYACWVTACRNVLRTTNHARQQNPAPSNHLQDSMCKTLLHQRQTNFT